MTNSFWESKSSSGIQFVRFLSILSEYRVAVIHRAYIFH